MPFLLLPGYASFLGAKPMDSALLFTALGGSNTLGRLLAGAFKGRKYINAVIVNNIALIVAGAATVAVPYITSVGYLYIYVCVFGLCIGESYNCKSLRVKSGNFILSCESLCYLLPLSYPIVTKIIKSAVVSLCGRSFPHSNLLISDLFGPVFCLDSMQFLLVLTGYCTSKLNLSISFTNMLFVYKLAMFSSILHKISVSIQYFFMIFILCILMH